MADVPISVRPSGNPLVLVKQLPDCPSHNVTYRAYVDSRIRRICQSRGRFELYHEHGLGVLVMAAAGMARGHALVYP